MKNMFNKDFLFGAATAAYQVEGAWNQDGKEASNWDAFVKIPGHTYNNTNGDIAADHYNRFKEDVALMKEQGARAYRFSIMWSRIYPDGFGDTPNEKGIQFYTKLINELIKNNIDPQVTIHHWDMPLQVQGSGGFETEFGREAFYKLAKLCFEKWGNKVSKWFIYNEMNINITMGYIAGKSPPGINNNHRRAANASYFTTVAISNVVKIYKKMGYKGLIGVAHAYMLAHPLSKSKEDILAAKHFTEIFNDWFLDPLIKGEFKKEHLIIAKQHGVNPTTEELKIIKENTINFLGINYYNHTIVGKSTNNVKLNINNSGNKSSMVFGLDGVFQTHPYGPDIKTTDWGWGIYPEGLYETLKEIDMKYGKIPIVISKNGIGLVETLDSNGEIIDDDRIEFLKGHLKSINKALNEGIEVIGYCNWSFIDLLSWHNGYKKRYGFVYIDKENDNKRIKKKSFNWYKEVINSNGKILFE